MKKTNDFTATKKSWVIFLPEGDSPRSAIVFEGFNSMGSDMVIYDNQSSWEKEKKRLGTIDLGELK